LEHRISGLIDLLQNKISAVYSVFDYFVLGINVLNIYFLSKDYQQIWLFTWGPPRQRLCVDVVRIVNVTLFTLYFLAVLFIDKVRPSLTQTVFRDLRGENQ
jgi:hypothetical protein